MAIVTTCVCINISHNFV